MASRIARKSRLLSIVHVSIQAVILRRVGIVTVRSITDEYYVSVRANNKATNTRLDLMFLTECCHVKSSDLRYHLSSALVRSSNPSSLSPSSIILHFRLLSPTSLLHPHVSFRLLSRPLTTTSLRLLLRRLPLCRRLRLYPLVSPAFVYPSALSDTCLCLLLHRHLRSTPSCTPLPSSLLRLSVSSVPLCSHLLCPTAGHNLRPPPASSTLLRHLRYRWHLPHSRCRPAAVIPPSRSRL